MSERPGTLDALLRPRSVAMIGASRRRGSIGGEIFHNLVSSGFHGAVYPVNATAGSVQAVRAYPSVMEIPDDIDLAVIAVPASQVLAAVDDCARKAVRGLVVITAGFGETGPAGKALQDEVVRRARSAGMRMVGPNCLGVVNRDPAVALNATFAPVWPPFGGVAIASQSGALGQAILEYARDLGIGISQFVAMGNKADISGNDLIAAWEGDPATRVILLYLESLGNPRRFMELSRRVTRSKPIAMVKSGRTAAGARAARSHTGALAGREVAVDALLLQSGVLRADTIEELFDLAMLLDSQPVARGRRVGILTNAGGPGIMASDACESHGLIVPALASPTQAALRAFLPPEASVRNPIDMIASASAEAYRRALPLLLADEGVDSVIVLFVPPVTTDATRVAEAIRDGAAAAKKPVLTCFMGKHGIPEALPSLREGRLPSYMFPESAAIALAHAARYGEWQRRTEGRFVELSAEAVERVRAIVKAAPGGWLGPDAVSALLDACAIATPRQSVVLTAPAAAEAAREIGFPVALKLVSRTLTHKTEAGGVFLDLRDEGAVAEAFAALERRLASLGLRAEMEGALVQRMAPRGVETLVGMSREPTYGPLIAFGIGGTQVELWRDIVFRVSPLTDVDAHEMVEQIRGTALLDGFRGAPPADRAAIVRTLLHVAALAEAAPEIEEIDLNPLLAGPPGEGVLAVDARIRIRSG